MVSRDLFCNECNNTRASINFTTDSVSVSRDFSETFANQQHQKIYSFLKTV